MAFSTATARADTAASASERTWRQQLAAYEYHPSLGAKGLQAPNRAQGFRSVFDAAEVRWVSRDDDARAIASLRLQSYGGADIERRPQFGSPRVEATSVHLHDPWIAVRHENAPTGLHSEWTFSRQIDRSGYVALDFQLSEARPTPQQGSIPLRGPAGSLQIHAWQASDADGRDLPVEIATHGDRLTIRVQDQIAVYPIRIKTLVTGLADARVEANVANSELGFSVAGAGDVNSDGFADVIVGAPQFDDGAAGNGVAFIFLGVPGGFDPSPDAILRGNPVQLGAGIGFSVAGLGDVNGDGYADVAVGAPLYDGGETNEGAVFMYLGGAGAFDTVPDARLDSDQVGAGMGESVAGAGDVNGDGFDDVIVGVPSYDAGQNNEGAAFLYFGSAGAFDNTVDALLESNQATGQMGQSVSGAGDVNGDGFADIVVGVPEFTNGSSAEGGAFLYFGGPGSFNLAVDAVLESNQVNPSFGFSVAGAGDVNGDGFSDVIVGAPFFDNGESDEGLAFIYLGGAGSFNTTADAQLEANQSAARFGSSVSGGSDLNADGYADVLIGARLFDNGQGDEGAMFVYHGGASFNAGADASLESDQPNAELGTSVAHLGDVNGDGYGDVIAGAPRFSNGEVREGAGLVYFGGAGTLRPADAQLEANQSNAAFGVSVASAGDVNGDGFSDIVVGAPKFDAGESNEGAAFLYLGGLGVLDLVPDARLEANQANAEFGTSVEGAGDVNGDGYGDVIVGAPFANLGETGEGAAYLYFGGDGAFNIVADAQLDSNQANAEMGSSVAGAGDVNGDGYADLLIGAKRYDGGASNQGAGFIYFGGAGAFDSNQDALLSIVQTEALVGSIAASAGDVNGDGFDDVLLGATGYANGQAFEGAALLYVGGAGEFNTTVDAIIEGNSSGVQMGVSVAGAGDVNGDGFSDVIVGADLFGGTSQSGAAFLFLGGSGVFNTDMDAILSQFQAGSRFGRSVAGAGDLNADGYADIVVGAPLHAIGLSPQGAAFVYHGGPGTFNAVADASLVSGQAGAEFGNNVASAGDVNGDGFADLIVGASAFDNGQVDEGAAMVYQGSALGRLVQLAQLRGDGSTPVEVGGLSQQTDGFLVAMQATSVRGRERARLQIEVCPSGVGFGALICERRAGATWTDLGSQPLGATLSLPIAGLTNQRLYHWRVRTQYSALHATSANGIGIAAEPRSGPWRRVQATANLSDIRTGSTTSPTDAIFQNGFE